MKTNIGRFNLLIYLFVLLLLNNEINAQNCDANPCPDEACDEFVTAGIPNWSISNEVYIDSTTEYQFELDSFLVEPNGLPDYAYFITSMDEDGICTIVDVIYDGTWDYRDADGNLFEDGKYCLTGLAYDQIDIELALNNIIINAVLNQCSPAGIFVEIDSLHQMMNLINNTTNSICDEQPTYSVDSMLCIIRTQFSIVIGYVPCLLKTEESFCFELNTGEEINAPCVDQYAGIPSWPEVDTVYYDSINGVPINNDTLRIVSFQEEPIGFDDYGYFITGPFENGINPVVGFTDNGLWDLKDADGNIMPEGEYCFTGFGYDADDIVEIGDNPIARNIICQCFDTMSCPFNDPYTFEGLVDVFIKNENSICEDSTKLTLDSLAFIYGMESICALVSEESFCFQLAVLDIPVFEIIVNDDVIIIGTDTIYIGEEYLYTSNDSILLGIDTFLVFGMDTLFMNNDYIEIGSYEIDINVELVESEIIVNDDVIIIGIDTIYIGEEYLYTSNDSILIGTDTFLVFGMDTLFMNRDFVEVGTHNIDITNIGVTDFELGFGTANVFPNPVAAIVSIVFESVMNTPAIIEIYDVSGRLIHLKVEYVSIGMNCFYINADFWDSGFYFAKISSGNDAVVVKFLKE